MTKTVNISVETARHAIACIQARAEEGLQLLSNAAEDETPEYAKAVADAKSVIAALWQAEMELLTAIDQAEG
jgi:gamma-glutamylcyclotransferase (GGCT)/AIG2-like uncharacterized protein YtfP